MIKCEIYKCEYCGQVYLNKEEAEACEKLHVEPKEIISCVYRNEQKYPHYIKVRMNNDELVEFVNTRYT